MLINNVLMHKIFLNVFEIFFPETCLNCHDVLEKKGIYLCFSCLTELPLTDFSNRQENELEKSFMGRIPLKGGTSLFFFTNKGVVQRLIHQMKYHHKPEIGVFLAKWLAEEMRQSKRFDNVQCIVPVPLHPIKQKKRGFNQVHLFAETLSDQLNIDCYKNCLVRKKNKKTQTQKNRWARMHAKKTEYSVVDSKLLKNKHVLLVDDVITSGATMQACSDALLDVSGISLSLASMAFTL